MVVERRPRAISLGLSAGRWILSSCMFSRITGAWFQKAPARSRTVPENRMRPRFGPMRDDPPSSQ